MADYSFYVSAYRGMSIPEGEFPRLAKRAGEVLGRYRRLYTVTAPDAQAEDMAACAMADALYYFETAQPMADLTFNTAAGSTVDRKLLILYLNTGTASAPVWSAIGKRVEDSSMEYDWGEESKTDIFGETYTTAKVPVITQTFEPCELDAGDAAQAKIWNQSIKDQDVGAMTNNDLLVVHAYAGTEAAAFAERYASCMVKPSGLGGSANVGMPLDVTFGGKRETGTAAVAEGVVTFTAAAAAGA